MKKLKLFLLLVIGSLTFAGHAQTTMDNYVKPAGADNFYHSYSVKEQQVSFPNQYKMKVAGTLFIPNSLIIYDAVTPFINRDEHLASGISHLPNQSGLLFIVLGMEPGPV